MPNIDQWVVFTGQNHQCCVPLMYRYRKNTLAKPIFIPKQIKGALSTFGQLTPWWFEDGLSGFGDAKCIDGVIVAFESFCSNRTK
jgi:hypothetical protein